MATDSYIHILGGGVAGLATGWRARLAGRPFTIHEAGEQLGGHCRTIRRGEFRFDTGAHRIHDRDPLVTADLRALLGEDLVRVEAPSVVWRDGRTVDFPLSPLDLLRNLGPAVVTRAAVDLARARALPRAPVASFEDFALDTYGRTIAELFLLGYSEKLWGAPCRRLAPHVAGRRMRGLDLRTLVTEATLGRRGKTRHLDGAFLYPRQGIGAVPDALARACGPGNARTGSRIVRVVREADRIEAVEIDGEGTVETDRVVSTIPLPALVSMMDPPPPGEILAAARRLRTRSLVLVAIMLRIPRVTDAATVYFPEPSVPFTRMAEPRNRSRDMSPPGSTSLVVEVPCQRGDAVWKEADDSIADRVQDTLVSMGWFSPSDVIDAAVVRAPDAYPVLELGVEHALPRITGWLGRIGNLSLLGRAGVFDYLHVHDLLRASRDLSGGFARGR